MKFGDKLAGGISKPTEEERALQLAAHQAKMQEHAGRTAREDQRQAFSASPMGRARRAFERGDSVFQVAIDVMNQQAIIVAMVGSNTLQRTSDPTDILNSVCREGWELVNGSFVFVERGQQSRDKFMASGQNVAIKGMTVGYYLFRRCETAKVDLPDPWETQ